MNILGGNIMSSNVYSYQVVINGSLLKDLIDADNPQDALEKVVHMYNREIISIRQGTPSSFNAATNLVKKGGKKVEKKSQSFYIMETKEKENKNPVILIRKEAGKKKDAFRCINEQSIPDFLHNSIKVKENIIYLNALEGIEQVPLSARPVIAYEKLDKSKVGNANKLHANSNGDIYNVWWKKNADTTLIEKNGAFYTIDNPVEAQLVTSDYPTFLGNAAKSLLKQDKNGWKYKVSWSPDILFATNNKGYWVKYGEGDFNFLEIGTPSADAYIVCDKQGNKLCTLNEFFNKHTIKK